MSPRRQPAAARRPRRPAGRARRQVRGWRAPGLGLCGPGGGGAGAPRGLLGAAEGRGEAARREERGAAVPVPESGSGGRRGGPRPLSGLTGAGAAALGWQRPGAGRGAEAAAGQSAAVRAAGPGRRQWVLSAARAAGRKAEPGARPPRERWGVCARLCGSPLGRSFFCGNSGLAVLPKIPCRPSCAERTERFVGFCLETSRLTRPVRPRQSQEALPVSHVQCCASALKTHGSGTAPAERGAQALCTCAISARSSPGHRAGCHFAGCCANRTKSTCPKCVTKTAVRHR